MAETTQNSSFKTKMGSVPNTLGLIPEVGALLFDISQGAPVVGDGINWLTFQPAIDAIALAANGTVFEDILTAATPVEPADYFSIILYNYGTALTPVVIGQTVTINTTGSYRINYNFNAQSSVPNTTLLFDIAVNGTPLGSPISLFLGKKDTPFSFTGQFVIPGITAADILTLQIETDKSCTLQRFNQEVGISLV